MKAKPEFLATKNSWYMMCRRMQRITSTSKLSILNESGLSKISCSEYKINRLLRARMDNGLYKVSNRGDIIRERPLIFAAVPLVNVPEKHITPEAL